MPTPPPTNTSARRWSGVTPEKRVVRRFLVVVLRGAELDPSRSDQILELSHRGWSKPSAHCPDATADPQRAHEGHQDAIKGRPLSRYPQWSAGQDEEAQTHSSQRYEDEPTS